MAHSGSAFSASSKDFCEARYQNECWYSIAWSKCCCASGLHDVSKWTLPRSCGGAAATADCPNAPAIATAAIAVRRVLIIVGFLVYPLCVQKGRTKCGACFGHSREDPDYRSSLSLNK